MVNKCLQQVYALSHTLFKPFVNSALAEWVRNTWDVIRVVKYILCYLLITNYMRTMMLFIHFEIEREQLTLVFRNIHGEDTVYDDW